MRIDLCLPFSALAPANRRRTLTALCLLSLGGIACQATPAPSDPASTDEGPRGVGKADAISGSCDVPDAAPACGTKSPDGCWCDDLCMHYGDCCSDYVPVCVCDCDAPDASQNPDACAEVCEPEPAPDPDPEPEPDPVPACEANGLAGGSPSFSIDERFQAVDQPIGLHATDLDADGNLDLLVVDRINDDPDQTQLVVLHGAGDGTFTAGTAVQETPIPDTIQAADLDGDGHLDVAMLVSGWDLVVYRGDGAGGLHDRVRYDNSNGIARLGFADLDADGDLDAVLTRTNRVFVKLNAGDGTFGILTPYDIDGHSIRDLSLVDFDGDGAIDVTAAETDSQHGGLLVLPGLGNGQLDSSALHVVDMGDGSNGGTMASDLDGDGHVDVITNDEHGRLLLRFGQGEGVLSPTPFEFNAVTLGPVWRFEAHDFNCDGAADVTAFGQLFQDGISVHTQRADGSFGYATGVNLNGSDDVAWGDFDNDGATDIAVAINFENHLNDIHEVRFYGNTLSAPQ